MRFSSLSELLGRVVKRVYATVGQKRDSERGLEAITVGLKKRKVGRKKKDAAPTTNELEYRLDDR